MMRRGVGFVVCWSLLTGCVLPAIGGSDASAWLDLRVELLRRLGHMPSFSACIIKGEDIVWQGAWGWADVYRSVPASEETQYMIGSVSKMFTAVAILKLAESGRLALDEDVSPFLPFDLRNPAYPDEPITFRMLLSHRASLAAENGHFFPTFYFRSYDRSELAACLVPGREAYRPTYWLDVRPGTRMEYANLGYELLAYLVERIAGRPFADVVEESVFEPLGMQRTTFESARATSQAMPYVALLGIPIPLGHYEIGSLGAGGIRTTVGDLSRFVIALMNGGTYRGTRILEAASVAEMQAVQGPGEADAQFSYGLGWMVFPETGLGGHLGGAFGCRTTVEIRTSDRTAVIWTFNRLNPALPATFAPLLDVAAARLDRVLWRLAETY